MSGFAGRNRAMLIEAQGALNIGFGAILSAYIGNSLAEIDDRPFDHMTLARFFVGVAIFILGLSLGNAMLLRAEYRLSALFLAVGAAAAVLAHAQGRALGFEVSVLRVLTGCWVAALLASDAVLTLVNYVHHRAGGFAAARGKRSR